RSAWAVNKNYENQRSAVCEAGDVETKIIGSPKQGDVKKCLSEKDDNGVVGKPSGSGSSSSKDEDNSDDSDSDEDSNESSGASAVTAQLAAAVAAVMLLAF
ncbi:hypothetical protein IW142_001519, partial [Coemansia sp. RSA 564]